MGRKSVAVLDVRSSEVAVYVGERGVNRTIVFTASNAQSYDGYDEEGRFLDEKGLSEAVFKAISAVEQTLGKRLRSLYIGVPGEFITIVSKEKNIAFPKRRKITPHDVDTLFRSGEETIKGHTAIRATSMIFVTSDNRRVVDPVGLAASSLIGSLSYFYCNDYFTRVMDGIFSRMKIKLHYLPTQYAMATCLIPSETRNEDAVFLDVGHLSSTILIVRGGGVLAQRSFWVGRGQIAMYLADQFSLPYEAALELLSKCNLFIKSNAGRMEYIYRGTPYEVDMNAFVETVKEGLDELCEAVGGFLETNYYKELDFKPLHISGEGLADIRGAVEHISRRINRVCEPVVPDMPFYNKPAMSSRIALIDMASDDSRNSGFLYRLLNEFGG